MKIIDLPDYDVTTTLHESTDSVVYRAIHNKSNQALIIKMLRKDYPTPAELARYRREFKILRSLNTHNVVKAYQLGKYQNTLFLTLEDFNAQPLNQWLKQPFDQGGLKNSPITTFLALAIKLARSLGELHAINVIHKDINPSNIVWNSDTEQLKIIDLGIASYLPLEYLSLQNPEHLEGTLAYLSPEQTGRINRAVDYRSDLYSLGVTFYEMLSGQLPFSATDAMELVHCHIAEIPVPVCEINPAVPQVLSDIVMKLMAKNAEDRYQSAFGVQADLEHCLATNCQTFELAQNDFSGRFQIPQKLYGREAEIQALLQAFARVSQGGCEMMLIAGYSGVGKTALVREVYKPMTEKRAYFAAGKFDQFQRNIPYSGLFQALDTLCDYVLSESSEQISHWRMLILDAVGDNGQVLTDVVPKLELIIGKQTAAAQVSAVDAKNRFNLVFQQFFKAISRAEHPFILFVDDLQWADTSSLNLLKALMSDVACQYLLIIGAYRENEVGEAHEVTVLAETLHKAHAAVTTIKLPNLLFNDVNTLIAESLMVSLDFSHPLTQLVYEKTQGNAFFVHEFLKSLYQKMLLSFDGEKRLWQWNVAEIAALNMTGNVTNLMVAKISKLSDQTQTVLKFSACVGNRFDLKTLSLLCAQSPATTLQDLWEAIENGLVNPLDDKYKQLDNQDAPNVNSLFCFQHDRVQQAAYSLLEAIEKPGLHYKIGQLLLTDSTELEERLFEIVDHLNCGISLVKQQAEKIRIAQLNLQAGQKAKATIAYSAALNYFRAGIALLPADSWQQQYTLTLALYEEAAATAALNGDFAQMQMWSASVFEQAKTVLDAVKTYETQIHVYSGQNKLAEAIKTGLHVLHLLGCDLPENPSIDDIQQGFAETMAMLPQPDIQPLLHLPAMTDATALAMMRIIVSIVPPTFQAAPDLFRMLGYEEVKLSIRYGNAPFSACGYADFGKILVGRFHDIELGYRFGQIAVALVEQHNSKEAKPQALFKATAVTFYGKHLIAETLPLFLRTYQASIEVGDLLHAGFAAAFQSAYGYFANLELNELEQIVVANTKRINPLRQDGALIFNQMFHQLVLNLKQETAQPWILTGRIIDETQLLNTLRQVNARAALNALFLAKLILACLFKKNTLALDSADQAKQYLDGTKGFLQDPLFYFYDSLAQLSSADASSAPEQQQRILSRVTENQAHLKHWLPHSAMNFQHKYDLVAAEQCRISGQIVKAMDKYESAIAGAEQYAYVQDAALAYELAAEFYFSRSMDKIAQLYLREAYYRYQQWGATTKLKQLESHYPQLVLNPMASPLGRYTTVTTLTSSTGSGSVELLDLATVMKAGRIISGEIVLDKLLEKMMRIVIENAGAQRGLLILKQNTQWLIQAKFEMQPKTVEVLSNIALESIVEHNQPLLPVSIVNYVMRTHKNVVLSDASREGQFVQSAYIAKQHPKSILCMPLINQGRLSGILYLENNAIVGAFTPDRLEILSLLSSQMAVSIENAVLYNELEQKVAERTVELDKALAALWSEMELAKRIQTCLLPEKPLMAGYDIAASCQPFDEVGGDYYDVISIAGYDWLVMGDVSGHGVTSGLVMMMVQTAIHTVLTSNPAISPEQALLIINRIIYDNIIKMAESKHMTIVLLANDKDKTGQFSFAGQHEDILLYRAATKTIERIEIDGFWIGIEPDISHLLTTNTLTLNVQDCMVLFTDGVTEARCGQEMFGMERLIQCIEAAGDNSAAAVHAQIQEALQGCKKSDDVTLVVVKRM